MHTGLKKLGILLGIFLLLTGAGGLLSWSVNQGEGQTKEKTEESFQVVTSFYPMYVATMNLVEDIEGVVLSNLTENQGGCLHDYQLTTADMKKLEKADVLVINGGGMEAFLGEIQAAYPELAIIDASVGLEAEEGNAHYWMDPENYKRQLENIAAGLKALDTEHQEAYEKNAAAYEKRVDEAEKELVSAVEGLPKEKAVLFHDAFYYLAKRLGIEVVYSIELEEDTVLNTGEIAEIVDKIEAEGVRLLFTEKQLSEAIPSGISRETGAELCIVDTLISGAMEKDAYLEGMEQNRRTLLECFAAME